MDINEIDLIMLEANNEEISMSFSLSTRNLGFPAIKQDIINNITEKNFYFDHIIQKENSRDTNDETSEKFKGYIKLNENKFNNIDISNGDLKISNSIDSVNLNNNINTNINNKTLPINKIKMEKKIIKLNKKRRIFNVVYPNTFFIFHKGGNDKYIRKYIEESLKSLPNERGCLFPFKNSKIKKTRRNYADLIRKKIKTTFLKDLKIQVNKKLKLAGSIKKFNYLQQIFITNITKEINVGVLDLTFKELFSFNFCKYEIDDDPNLQKYKDNIAVIKYLEARPEISKKSNYKIFKDIKYYQIFEEYLNSIEFENDIKKLMKKYNYEYIKKYIKLAFNLNDFFYH